MHRRIIQFPNACLSVSCSWYLLIAADFWCVEKLAHDTDLLMKLIDEVSFVYFFGSNIYLDVIIKLPFLDQKFFMSTVAE